MNRAVDRSMREAVARGVFPSAELLVARGGEPIHHEYYGDARPGTCYDVASLTKPLCTSSLAMLLHAEGIIELDQTLGGWFGERCGPESRALSIGSLLNHVSGLPAWRPFYRELPAALVGTEQGRQFIIDACLNEPPIGEPGATTYSDIGYILLGELIATAGESPLDRLFADRIAAPLNLTNTFFVRNGPEEIKTSSRRTDTSPGQHVPLREQHPPRDSDARTRRFAATEDCHWRNRVVHGHVHDQNAYAMGGVAGHAGLFSDASDIHAFITGFLGSFSSKGFIPRATLERFFPLEGSLIAPPASGVFVGGWDTPSAKNSAAGHYSSTHAIGHLAYTGCSLWIDQEQDFWVILLTNRIHPQATNDRIKAFRPHIHDLVHNELIDRRT